MGVPSLILLSFLCYYTYGLDLTAYQAASYVNPVGTSEFTHFVTHNVTGTVYIGASDVLYQLREDFTREQVVNMEVECEGRSAECPNYNKILLIDYEYDRLITCGSETVGRYGRGTCETRDLSDIMTVLHKNEFPVVSSGMLTTEAVIAPGTRNGGANALYVAATHEDARWIDVPPVTRRTLGNDSDLFSKKSEANVLLYTIITSFSSFLIRYSYTYTWKEFTYFVTHQRQEEESDFISKIQRVCQNSEHFNSFTEITLECQGQSGTVYNLIQAAYVGAAGPDLAASLSISAGDDVFYGVFAKTIDETVEPEDYYVPRMESALCVFKMEDIENMFYDTVAGCFASGGGREVSEAYQVNYLQGAGGGCRGLALTEAQVMSQLCTANNWQYAKSVDSLESIAVIEWSDITPSSIITTTHRQHTMAWIGTAQGDMVKVHIADKDKGREYERFSVGDHVLRDAELDKDVEQLTILTKQQLLKLKTSGCSEYTTCDECIGVNGAEDGDPYCGWCTLEKRCSLYSSCPMSDVSTRWLPYNSAQCVDISKVSPYDSLPITVTQQQITLTVEQLPDLADGNSYQCIFDDIPPVAANKVGNELTCTTPAADNIPNIPSGKDHVTMQLHVSSTETDVKFVQGDFHFYECNTHKGCVACTSSDWACDWCIYSNKCTHDSSTCSEDNPSSVINGENNPEMSPRQGSGECPQLAEQTEESLVSVGVSRPISVTGVNLPEEGAGMATSYKCILDIEGSKIETRATRNGNDFTCTPKMYAYTRAVQELSVSLAVIWNDDRRLDDVFGFKVTLYKCDVDRPDCSRCLSGLTSARPEFMCGWCKTDGICTVSDSSVCSEGWIPVDTEENCPAPVLTGVWPPSGPHEGNTVIAVTGTDLGLQFSDVMMVTVGGQDCSTDGLEGRYLAGSSVSCRTLSGDIDSEEAISVRVQGADGTQQQSSGEVAFTYRNPLLISFEPREGFAAGGTMVTITGQYLNACSEISATIGSQCIMNRMDDVLNETTAMCRTTKSSIDSSHPLVVSFDGATRESQDTFTYKPNPTVSDVQPLKTILSGGITLTVTGKGFGLAQQPQMIMFIGDQQFKEKCEVQNDTMILCKTPDTTTSPDNVSRRRKRAPEGQASFGFIIGDVMDLLRWSDNNNVTLEYYEDPVYFPFEENPKRKSGDVDIIMGSNLDVASFERDVTVYIGSEPAETNSLDTATLTITLPKNNPGKNCINGSKTTYPCVVVRHGNLEINIGSLQYPSQSIIQKIILAVVVTFVLVLLVLLVIALANYVIQHRKLLRERDALILERLVLLQKNVEDDLGNLKSESSRKQHASIVLPNNVQISSEDVIRFNALTIGRILGQGAFGKVYQAVLTTHGGITRRQVAVKSIQGEKDASSIIEFLEEGLIMKDFDHDNVLGMIGMTFDPEGSPLVVIPLMTNGDLKSFLKKTTLEITSEQKLKFAIDAANGMTYLSDKKFVHRDLAARNCMVDENLVVKIGDFGRSRDLEDSDDYVSQDKKAKIPVKWMAPESLGRRVYNEKTDVWSYGVLLWEIYTNGAKPYRQIANKDIYYHIIQGNRLSCPGDCRQDVYDVMKLCWSRNPKGRCTFRKLAQRLSFILNLQMHAGTAQSSTQGIDNPEYHKMTQPEPIIRDSYLHPMDGPSDVVEMKTINSQ